MKNHQVLWFYFTTLCVKGEYYAARLRSSLQNGGGPFEFFDTPLEGNVREVTRVFGTSNYGQLFIFIYTF